MKKLTEYQAIIVDLDGTLYYQRPVRFAMLKEMAFRFWKVSDFLIVKKYRELYSRGVPRQERLAQLPRRASAIIQSWMIDRPCPYIAKYGDYELLRLLTDAKAAGTPVIVYSDYPVKEKLNALGFVPDMALCSEDIGSLKPDADGLKRVLSAKDIIPEHCLIIGDREEKDGALAANLGSDSLIVPRNPAARKTVYQRYRPAHQNCTELHR